MLNISKVLVVLVHLQNTFSALCLCKSIKYYTNVIFRLLNSVKENVKDVYLRDKASFQASAVLILSHESIIICLICILLQHLGGICYTMRISGMLSLEPGLYSDLESKGKDLWLC